MTNRAYSRPPDAPARESAASAQLRNPAPLPALRAGVLCAASLLVVVWHARADGADPESLAFFENEIRPLLVQHCIECHGPKKSESGLRLDALTGAIKGGDSGPTGAC